MSSFFSLFPSQFSTTLHTKNIHFRGNSAASLNVYHPDFFICRSPHPSPSISLLICLSCSPSPLPPLLKSVFGAFFLVSLWLDQFIRWCHLTETDSSQTLHQNLLDETRNALNTTQLLLLPSPTNPKLCLCSAGTSCTSSPRWLKSVLYCLHVNSFRRPGVSLRGNVFGIFQKGP